jgi:uncharacterized membrane protein YfcA
LVASTISPHPEGQSMSTEFIIVVAATGLIIGLAKGGLGGLAMVVVPLLSLVMKTQVAVATALPLLLVGDAFATWTYWRRWDMKYTWLMVPAGVVGTIIGTLILARINESLLRQIIGIMTLLYVVYRVSANWIAGSTYDPPDWLGQVAGFVAGITSSLAGAGAPPYAAYLLLKRLSPTAFMGTFTLFFVVSNIVKLPAFYQQNLFDFGLLLRVIWSIPLIPLGVWLGRRLIRGMEPAIFDRIILAILAATGVWLIVETMISAGR